MDIESRQSVRDDVRVIESSLKYANDLLHSMLDLNRGNTEITIRSLPTDIKRDILQPVASMIYHRDETFEVQVECCDSLIVSVDRLRLKQIVLNLARNSSRYVTEGGFVKLIAHPIIVDTPFDTKTKRNKSINYIADYSNRSTAPRDSGICISVEDSGPGVPKEKREMLFKRYQKSLEEMNQGAGIGLSLCKKLIDFMDGTISIDDSYNSGVPGMPGAKFDVRLKCDSIKVEMDSLSDSTSRSEKSSSTNISLALLHSGPTGTSSASSPIQQHNQQQKSLDSSSDRYLPDHLTVLFVDDDMVLRKLFARSLRRICPDWSIHEAASGEAALAMVDSEGPSAFDLIFLDQYMASVDKQLLGTETARLLRSKGVTSIICGLSANDMYDSFKAAGADNFMTKPFPCDPTALRLAMSKLVSGRPTIPSSLNRNDTTTTVQSSSSSALSSVV
jgi:CheY-like chemotaxis protein